MKTVAVIAQKGGSGKTTLSTNLAVLADRSGLISVIFDLDPQGTASIWGDARGDPPQVVAVQPSRFARMLDNARVKGAEVVFVDTPPHIGEEAGEIARLADVVLIPCRPSSFDLEALPKTLRACAGREAWVVLNSVPGTSKIGDEAAVALTKAKVKVAPHRVGQRIGFVNPLPAGRSVAEWEPTSKGAGEMEALWEWLSGRLGLVQK